MNYSHGLYLSGNVSAAYNARYVLGIYINKCAAAKSSFQLPSDTAIFIRAAVQGTLDVIHFNVSEEIAGNTDFGYSSLFYIKTAADISASASFTPDYVKFRAFSVNVFPVRKFFCRNFFNSS